MKKFYQIADDAGMNPDQFYKVRNGRFVELATCDVLFRKIMASAKASQFLGFESVFAKDLQVMSQFTIPFCHLFTRLLKVH